MQFYERFRNLCIEIGKTPTGVGKELNIDGSTVNYWKKSHTPKQENLSKIAAYFNVSIDYLLGNTELRNAPNNQSVDDIAKVALFGGDTDVTDEMWNEAKQYAEFIKERERKKKSE